MRIEPLHHGIVTVVAVALLAVTAGTAQAHNQMEVIPAADITVYPGDSDVLMAQVTLHWNNGEPGDVFPGDVDTHVELGHLGTGDDTGLTGIRLVLDENTDGVYQAGEMVLATGIGPDKDDGQSVLDGVAGGWLQAGENHLLLLADFGVDCTDGTYQMDIQWITTNEIGYGPMTLTLTATHTLVAEYVRVDSSPLQIDLVVQPEATDVVMGIVDLTPYPFSPTLDTLSITRTAGDPSKFSSLRLIHDADANGQIDLTDPVLDSGQFFTDTITFGAGDLALPLDPPTTLIVAADFSSAAPDGMVFAFEFSDGETTGDTLNVAGLPQPSATVTIDIPVTPELTIQSPVLPDATVEPGTAHGVMIDLAVSATQATALSALRVVPTGSMASLSLVRDANGNGIVDGVGEIGGDQLLDTVANPITGQPFDLAAGSLALAPGSAALLLVTAGIAVDATPGADVTAVVTGAVTTGALPAPDLPLTGATLTVEGEADLDDDASTGAGNDLAGIMAGTSAACGAPLDGSLAGVLVWLLAIVGMAVLRRR